MISASCKAERLANDNPSSPSSPRPTIVNQGRLASMIRLLLLGGTAEATALAHRLKEIDISVTISLAGRVAHPARTPFPVRIGGFGGIDGLIHYVTTQKITHVVDATHPFAAQMSRHAVEACRTSEVPLMALTRPPWSPTADDQWECVSDFDGAAKLLEGHARRVMLAIGRMHLIKFSEHQQHYYLLRFVEPASAEPPFRQYCVLVDRGPFAKEADITLLREHRIDLIVARNSGGVGAQSKVLAARDLKIPVIMIQRPRICQRPQTHYLEDVVHWLFSGSTDLGV